MKDESVDKMVTTSDNFSLTPSNFEEAKELAEYMANSDMVPNDYKRKPGNVLIAVAMGAEVGLKPMGALQNIACINGRPSIWGDAALAIVMNHPEFESIVETAEGDAKSEGMATCTIIRRKKGKEIKVSRSFSIMDATRAGLWSKTGPWKQYPGRMLQMRARGFAMRDAFPDALKGLSLGEEQRDIVDVEFRDAEAKAEQPSYKWSADPEPKEDAKPERREKVEPMPDPEPSKEPEPKKEPEKDQVEPDQTSAPELMAKASQRAMRNWAFTSFGLDDQAFDSFLKSLGYESTAQIEKVAVDDVKAAIKAHALKNPKGGTGE